jgi:hypothetical protein
LMLKELASQTDVRVAAGILAQHLVNWRRLAFEERSMLLNSQTRWRKYQGLSECDGPVEP